MMEVSSSDANNAPTSESRSAGAATGDNETIYILDRTNKRRTTLKTSLLQQTFFPFSFFLFFLFPSDVRGCPDALHDNGA